MKAYSVQLEISGPTAMWTRPDTGSSPVSYVAPTFSAVKGIFEAVLRWKSVNIIPTRVEICKPVHFHRYATNYGGPLRASDIVAKGPSGPSFQLFATVLIDVCYRLYADLEVASQHDDTKSPAHAFRDAFNRKLEAGKWFCIPCLGWKEFVPNYVGQFRPGTKICVSESHEVPTMLRTVFDKLQNGNVSPRFDRTVSIREGVLNYA